VKFEGRESEVDERVRRRVDSMPLASDSIVAGLGPRRIVG